MLSRRLHMQFPCLPGAPGASSAFPALSSWQGDEENNISRRLARAGMRRVDEESRRGATIAEFIA